MVTRCIISTHGLSNGERARDEVPKVCGTFVFVHARVPHELADVALPSRRFAYRLAWNG